MSEKSSLALIVPCYNEAESIPPFATELVQFRNELVRSFPEVHLEIIFVNNNSTDKSAELLRELVSRHSWMRVENCARQGYGAALKTGFAAATAEYIGFLDLDNTYPLSEFQALLSKLQRETLDIIYGARIHEKSHIPAIRSLGNRIYVVLLRFLLNSKLTDVCSGMRVFRAEKKPEVLNLKAEDLSFSIEFTALAVKKGWKIGEHPIPYRNRTGKSKLSVPKDGILFLFVILREFFKGKA